VAQAVENSLMLKRRQIDSNKYEALKNEIEEKLEKPRKESPYIEWKKTYDGLEEAVRRTQER